MRRLIALLIILFAWTGAALIMAPWAGAHALLVGADPADSSRLTTAPARVTLQFSESVGLRIGHLQVLDGQGNRVDAGPATHPSDDNTKVTVALHSGLGDGSYVVSYAVVSADSHPISGGYAFVVGSGPLTSASGVVADGSGTDPVVGAVFAAARWISYAGVALIGGLVFVMFGWPAGRTDDWTRRTVRLGLILTAAGAVASLLLQGPYASGGGLGKVLSGSLVSATLGTAFGKLLVLRLAAVAAFVVVSRMVLRDQEGRPEAARFRDDNIAILCGLLLLGSVAGAGHAAAGPQSTVALLVDIGHVAAMSAWLGGLAVLTGWLRRTGSAGQSPLALAKFSRLATVSVSILAATGIYQAWRGLGAIPALWSTTYGQLLCLKLAGVLLVLAVASRSRRFVRGLGPEPEPEEHVGGVLTATRTSLPLPTLHRLVRTELAICVAVLGVTSVLVSTAPGRDVYVQPYDGSMPIPGGSAAISVSPARVGANSMRITLSAPGGRAIEPKAVTATLTLPADRLGPLPVQLTRTGPGSYVAASVPVPQVGQWELNVRVQMSDFDATVNEVAVKIR